MRATTAEVEGVEIKVIMNHNGQVTDVLECPECRESRLQPGGDSERHQRCLECGYDIHLSTTPPYFAHPEGFAR